MSSTSSNTGEFTYNELMEQYVKATRLIEHLKSQRDRSKRAFDKAMDLVLKYDARIAELEAAQRWIPVSERLPEDGETVFVIIHDGFERFENGNEVARLTYLGNGNWWSWESERYVVTHWMPLPSAPESEDE